MEFDEIIEKRHSVRKFTPKKPDWRKIIEAIDSARKTPLAGNLQPLKFIIVDDKDKIDKLAEGCMQSFIKKVDYLVVVCSDSANLERNYGSRGKMYSRQQAGAAIETFILKIGELGLATCWVGAFSDQIIKRILKIPAGVDVEAILPVGFEQGKGKQKRKTALDNLLYFNEWGESYMKPLEVIRK